MSNHIQFEDGHIEYFSVYTSKGLKMFDSQQKALDFIRDANDYIPGGVNFHKELNGKSILPSDLRGE